MNPVHPPRMGLAGVMALAAASGMVADILLCAATSMDIRSDAAIARFGWTTLALVEAAGMMAVWSAMWGGSLLARLLALRAMDGLRRVAGRLPRRAATLP